MSRTTHCQVNRLNTNIDVDIEYHAQAPQRARAPRRAHSS
jgi:hypothetical protein